MKRLSKSRLFFLELVIDLIFFFLCAAICVTLFGRAAQLSRQSRELNQALILAESTAETFRACGGDFEATRTQLGYNIHTGLIFAHFDADWNLTASANAYQLDAWGIPSDYDGSQELSIRITAADGREIYSISATVFSGEVQT